MSIPNDLIPLADVVARFPGKTMQDFQRMSRRKQFPDLMRVGGTIYVRQSDVDVWERGCWVSFRVEMAEAKLRHGHLVPIRNRRVKAGA